MTGLLEGVTTTGGRRHYAETMTSCGAGPGTVGPALCSTDSHPVLIYDQVWHDATRGLAKPVADRPACRRCVARAARHASCPPVLSLCEAGGAGPLASNHVRRVGPAGLQVGGGIRSAALCGRDLAGGWDLRVVDAGEIRRLAGTVNDAGRRWVCAACADVALRLLAEVKA